jgi:hypothetical protein
MQVPRKFVPRITRAFVTSGRQDLNLRPPGPQPEQSRLIRCVSASFRAIQAPECPSVALNLHPGLHPVAFRPCVRLGDEFRRMGESLVSC